MSRVTQEYAWHVLTSHTGLSPSAVRLSRRFRSSSHAIMAFLQPRPCPKTAAVWALPRSLATTGGIIDLFSLPRGTKMFQFPRLASHHNDAMSAVRADGLSHSEIRGSQAICALPRLIAAYHVLHRLREPRHPPCALSYFLLLATQTSKKPAGRQLILSACVSLAAPSLGRKALNFVGSLQFRLSQYVKDRFRYNSGWWRISDSNR